MAAIIHRKTRLGEGGYTPVLRTFDAPKLREYLWTQPPPLLLIAGTRVHGRLWSTGQIVRRIEPTSGVGSPDLINRRENPWRGGYLWPVVICRAGCYGTR